MPTPLRPLPDAIAAAPFSVQRAVALGVTSRRTRHPSLARPAYGLRTPWDPRTLAEATSALALVLPDPWAWSHETAAELLGLPLPQRWIPGRPLTVMRPIRAGPVRRRGIRGHTGLDQRGAVTVRGMPVVSPPATWCDLAGLLPLDDLVIMGDVVVMRGDSPDDVRMGTTSLVRLEAEVMRRAGTKGVAQARAAFAWVRVGSRSPMETRARLCFIRAGIPEPELNGDIHDDGRWVATGDFLWRSARVIVEYQGDQHRTDRRQWRSDLQRLAILQDLGWRVILMTGADLATATARDAFTTRLARALEGMT